MTLRIAFVAAFAQVVLIGNAADVSAQKLDLGTVKCSEWLNSGKENIGLTLAWLDAFYKDEDAQAVIDFDKMAENASKLAA